MRLKAECVLESRNFSLRVTGNFLRGCKPCPDIGPCRFLTSRGFQIRYCFQTLAAFAIVNAEEKIGANQRGVDLNRSAKLHHRFRDSILELVYQPEIHVSFGELRCLAENGLILTLCRAIVTPLLCLLGGIEVGLDSLIRGTLGDRGLIGRLRPTDAKQHKNRKYNSTPRESVRLV